MLATQVLNLFARWATRFPHRVLIGALLATLLAAGLASQLKISTSRTALVSDQAPHWKRYLEFAEEFGLPEDLVLVAQGQPEQVTAFIASTSAALRDSSGPPLKIFEKIELSELTQRGLWFLEEDNYQSLAGLLSEPAFAQLSEKHSAEQQLDGFSKLLKKLPQHLNSTSQLGSLGPEPLVQLSQDLVAALKGETLSAAELKKNSAFKQLFAGQGIDASGYLVSNGGRLALIFIRPPYLEDDMKAVRPFVERVRTIADTQKAHYPHIEYGLTGIPASMVDEFDSIQRDTIFTSALAVLGVALLFFGYFRGLRLLVIGLAPVLIGVVWTAAAIYLTFGQVNLMSSIFLVVLIGMGIDFSVHLSARFVEERRRGRDAQQAVELSLLGAGRGVITGALTSAGAFFVVGFSGFKGIEELGFAAAMGLLLTLLAALTVLPAILYLSADKLSIPDLGFPGLAQAFGKLAQNAKLILLTSALLTTAAVYAIPQSQFDFSLLNLLPEKAESALLMAKMADNRDLSANAVCIRSNSLPEARKLSGQLNQLPSVYRVQSAASFIPPSRPGRAKGLTRLQDTLTSSTSSSELGQPAIDESLERWLEALEAFSDLALRNGRADWVDELAAALEALEEAQELWEEAPEIERLGVLTKRLAKFHQTATQLALDSHQKGAPSIETIPKALRKRFVSERGNYALYVVPKESIWDREQLGVVLDEVRSLAPEVTGFPETFYENAALIKNGFFRSALFSGLAVLFILLVDLRGYALWAYLPVALGSLWMVGAMKLTGTAFNLANVVGLPLVIGVGIDNGVHLLHRFRESEKLADALENTGGAVLLSSLTTMVGFGTLAFASHRGYCSLGLILFIGVGACLLSSLLVLPAALQLSQGKKVQS